MAISQIVQNSLANTISLGPKITSVQVANSSYTVLDDTSINIFQFKTINEIKDDLCYKNLTSNINYSCNNALFHVLNNITDKKKENALLKRIERLEENSSIYIYTSIGCFILLAMRIFI